MAREGHGAAAARTMALVGLSAGLTLVHASARAQTVPSIDASTWHPSPDADASLVLQPATTPGAWRWNVGAWTQYAEDPVVYRNRGGQKLRPIAHFVGPHPTAGLGLGSRVEVGLALPLVVWQNGDSPLPVNLAQNGTVPTAAV